MLTIIEQLLSKRASAAMARHKNALNGVGIIFRDPELELWEADESQRTSELRIVLCRNGNVEDVFEFHLFRDGRQVVTGDEIEHWIDQQVEQLIGGTGPQV